MVPISHPIDLRYQNDSASCQPSSRKSSRYRPLCSKQYTAWLLGHRCPLKKPLAYRHCYRIKAVLAYDDSYSYSEISRILLLDDESIWRPISEYFKESKLSLESGGRSSFLRQDESSKFISHLPERLCLYVKGREASPGKPSCQWHDEMAPLK